MLLHSLKRYMLAGILSLSMVSGMLLSGGTTASAAVTLSNPTIDNPSNPNAVVTWDRVTFGSYPTVEIVEKKEDSGLSNWCTEENTYSVEPEIYEKLKNATGWNKNNDLVVDGKKYRRVTIEHVYTYGLGDTSTNSYNWGNSYDAAKNQYHYFRYEPITWRVLQVNGNQALLLSDKVLDEMGYCHDWYETVTHYNMCTIRSWLNGYGRTSNRDGHDYTGSGFLDVAFTAAEAQAILTTTVDCTTDKDNPNAKNLGGVDVQDKVFILSYGDVTNTAYGFSPYGGAAAKSRWVKSTAYAKCMGVTTTVNYSGDDNYKAYASSCEWMLRSATAFANYYYGVWSNGEIGGPNKDDKGWSNYIYYGYGIRPAITVNLSNASLTYLGQYCSEEFNNPCYKGHTEAVQPGYEAGCLETGLTDGIYCSVCNEVLVEQTVIPAMGHTVVVDKAVEATCLEYGLTEGSHCSVCGEVLEEQYYTPAFGHTEVADNAVEPTCTKAGKTEGSHCETCGEVFAAQKSIPAIGHDWTKSSSLTVKATISAAGKIVYVCENCDGKKSTTIPKISKVALSTSTYVYDGKVKSPTVKITDTKGKVLKCGTDYSLKTPTGRKNVGAYIYIVTFKGNYKGTKKLTLTINPKGTALTKLTALTKGFKAVWTKQATQTTGYQIQYSISSKFTSPKTVTVTSAKTTSSTKTGLTAKKKYYVRIRTYKTVSSKKYYSKWSAYKTVTTK